MHPQEAPSAVMEGAGWRRVLQRKDMVDAISTGLGFVPISSRPSALFHFLSASRAAPTSPIWWRASSAGPQTAFRPHLMQSLLWEHLCARGGWSEPLARPAVVPTPPGRPHWVLPVKVALRLRVSRLRSHWDRVQKSGSHHLHRLAKARASAQSAVTRAPCRPDSEEAPKPPKVCRTRPFPTAGSWLG